MTFLVLQYTSQDFAQTQKIFAQSHDCMTVTFRGSASEGRGTHGGARAPCTAALLSLALQPRTAAVLPSHALQQMTFTEATPSRTAPPKYAGRTIHKKSQKI